MECDIYLIHVDKLYSMKLISLNIVNIIVDRFLFEIKFLKLMFCNTTFMLTCYYWLDSVLRRIGNISAM